MKINCRSTVSERLKRIDGTITITKCTLVEEGGTRLDLYNPDISINNKLVHDYGARWEGIWENKNHLLKLSIVLPDNPDKTKDYIVGNTDYTLQKYIRIELTGDFADEYIEIVPSEGDSDLGLCTGKNLIDIQFSDEYVGALIIKGTTRDTKTLETFGRYPGKSIFITGNEDSEVSKETYFNYWRIKVCDDETTTDLPILDEYGKLISENYTFRVYSNLRLDCLGLYKTFTPNVKKISFTAGIVPINGLVDFIEYRVSGPHIYKTNSGTVSITDIPGFELKYLGGQNDFGIEVNEAANVFTIDNYGRVISYLEDQNPESTDDHKAVGLFEGIIYYYDILRQTPIALHSENKIKLARGNNVGIWWPTDDDNDVNSDTPYSDTDPELGELPVFLFEKTAGDEKRTSILIDTLIVDNLRDLQISLEYEDEELVTTYFDVFLDLDNAISAQDMITVPLIMKTKLENQDPMYRPIKENGNPYWSKVVFTNPETQDIFGLPFWMVQKANIGDGVKFVDDAGNDMDTVYLVGSNFKTTHIVDSNSTSTQETIGDFNKWVIIDSRDGINYRHPNDTNWIEYPGSSDIIGLLGTLGDSSYTGNENTLQIKYLGEPETAQTMNLGELRVARVENTNNMGEIDVRNWRIMAAVTFASLQILKQGQDIIANTTESITIHGLGLYKISIVTNCMFNIQLPNNETKCNIVSEDNIDGVYGVSVNSPSYNDQRFATREPFIYYLKVQEANYNTLTVTNDYYPNINIYFREPFTETAGIEQRTQSKTITTIIDSTNSGLYKLREDSTPYSNGEWLIKDSVEDYSENDWVKQVGYKEKRAYWEELDDAYYIYGEGGDYNIANKTDIAHLDLTNDIVDSEETPLNSYKYIYLGSTQTTSFGYQVGNSWYEIKRISSIQQLETFISRIIEEWDSSVFYHAGDIIKYNDQYYIARYSFIFDSSHDYLENINQTPGSNVWWYGLGGNSPQTETDIPGNFRYVVYNFEGKDYIFNYMNLVALTNVNVTGLNSVDEILEHLTPGQTLIERIIRNPQEYRNGFSIRFKRSTINVSNYNVFEQPMNTELRREDSSSIIGGRPILGNNSSSSRYLIVNRDSSWITVDSKSELEKATGINLNNVSADYNLGSLEFELLTRYSVLIPKLDIRESVKITAPIHHNSRLETGIDETTTDYDILEDFWNTLSYSSILDMFSFINYPELPTLDTVDRYTNTTEHFISTYYKLNDESRNIVVKLNKNIDKNTRIIPMSTLNNQTIIQKNTIVSLTTNSVNLYFKTNYETSLSKLKDSDIDWNEEYQDPIERYSLYQLLWGTNQIRNNTYSASFDDMYTIFKYRIKQVITNSSINQLPIVEVTSLPDIQSLVAQGKVVCSNYNSFWGNTYELAVETGLLPTGANLYRLSGQSDVYAPVWSRWYTTNNGNIIFYGNAMFYVSMNCQKTIQFVYDSNNQRDGLSMYYTRDYEFKKLCPYTCLNFKYIKKLSPQVPNDAGIESTITNRYNLPNDEVAVDYFNGGTQVDTIMMGHVGKLISGKYITNSTPGSIKLRDILNTNKILTGTQYPLRETSIKISDTLVPGDIIAVTSENNQYSGESSNNRLTLNWWWHSGDYYLYTAGWELEEFDESTSINITNLPNSSSIPEHPDHSVVVRVNSENIAVYVAEGDRLYAFNNIRPNRYLFFDSEDEGQTKFFRRKTNEFSNNIIPYSVDRFRINLNDIFTLDTEREDTDLYKETVLMVRGKPLYTTRPGGQITPTGESGIQLEPYPEEEVVTGRDFSDDFSTDFS